MNYRGWRDDLIQFTDSDGTVLIQQDIGSLQIKYEEVECILCLDGIPVGRIVTSHTEAARLDSGLGH